KQEATATRDMNAETKQQTELLDKFLTTYEVATMGDWFNKGKTWYRPIECPWISDHENPNQGTSTCIIYSEGSGYGFDCKHRCAGKTWHDLRAEVESRFPDRKFSFVQIEQPAKVSIGEQAKPGSHWRNRYHSFDEMNTAPEPTFIIEGFVQKDVITA